MDVGFIGLGGMARAMAANLVKAGHRVRVWNRTPAAAQPLVEAGATEVATADEAFVGDAAITMLADDAALREVVLEGGLLAGNSRPAMHLSMSTISVALARELTDRHAEAGIGYVAAPVFGRTEVAVAAQLNILAAGPAALIEAAGPLFDAMGQKVWRLGEEPARANVVKLPGNFMIAASVATFAEAMALGQANGVDPHDLHAVLTGTLFSGRVHTNYGKLIADRAYDPAFKLTLGLKDIRLALQAGEASTVPMPVASLLRDTLIEAVAHGDGERDWVALAEVAFRRAGIDRG